MALIARRDEDLCIFCGTCRNFVACPAGEVFSVNCIGCRACELACSGDAIKIINKKKDRKKINIRINGDDFSVPSRITIRDALAYAGIHFSHDMAPCGVGGCWCCSVLANGNAVPACITGVREGLVIDTEQKIEPRRVVTGFGPHMVGGVGTPISIRDYVYPVEVALFTHGCNFRCPQCQNHIMAFTGGMEMLPRQAAFILSNARRMYNVHRMAFSGGECTLNRSWLTETIRELNKLNQDEEARIHVDTNGSLLTEDYLDELVRAGMTDTGIDLKGIRLETFQRITGLDETIRAEFYLNNAWNAVKTLLEDYPQVFVGIGIPYNKDLISRDELKEMGERIYRISSEVQVCVLDYRPAFRKKMEPPTAGEMTEIKELLNGTGLANVISQVPGGHIGP